MAYYYVKHSYIFVNPRPGLIGDEYTLYASIGAMPQDTVDWCNLQMAINKATQTGRRIELRGEYTINRPLVAEKYKSLKIEGNGATIKTLDNIVMLDRPVPNDNGDANVMINQTWDIRNLKLKGGSIGLRPGPTYGNGEGSYLERIVGEDLDYVMDLEFCLNGNIISPSAVNCKHGWKIQYGARWGGNNSNSQSNNVRIFKPRFYSPSDGVYGIWVLGCSGVVVDEPIIEGFSVEAGINFDGNGSTVVKDFKVINGYHFECVNGARQAALKARILGGKVSLDGYFGQYPAIIADCASTGGYMEFEFKNIQWAKTVNGMLFMNGGCTWEGSYSQYENGAIKESNFPSLVGGITVQECGGDSCGYNKFWITEIPR